MAKITFNRFKQQLELGGTTDDRIEDWNALNGAVIKFNGEILGAEVVLYDTETNKVFLPNDDGSLMATAEYRSVGADEVHDWRLLK